jgi:hypothetical protein
MNVPHTVGANRQRHGEGVDMIVRTWKGWTATEQASAYEAYMHRVALKGYAEIDGNHGVLMVKRDLPSDLTEFLMITLWSDMDAIKSFAGDTPTRAVFYPEDDEFLVDREMVVSHYEVYGTTLGFEDPRPAQG